ncbi:DUF418 domain-containing protein YeiB [Brenneria corticis]|uniref:DUF418 domain-containing protein n=1 Tax=Brenneria corticis TaxID=2173106 RepID=A0A2U1U6U0_9GAMM|nr:DUF418 domain-containing protein YeiB [Brenneria sp. CFCC 11842]PWC17365.1 hypothetical protein DDT56_07535 [Brenneria sp. CFCC 11842]
MPAQPTPSSRIATLDFARGVAVLGILLLNITAFGLPKAAYLNPAWQGLPSPTDAWTWAIMDLAVQAKFLTLFSLLFGAGLQLLLPRGKRWVHARLFWLMLIGLVHAVFFWDGDILLDYGLIGLVCYGMIRHAEGSRALLRTGAIMYLVGVGVLFVLSRLLSPQPGRFWQPGAADITYEAYWKTTGGPEAWGNRVDLLTDSLLSLGVQYGWLLAGSMLLGAGLMRSGWLKGTFSQRHYRRIACWLIPLALLINGGGVAAQWLVQWEYRWSGLLLQIPRELSAILQAVGYLALCYGFWPTLCRWRITYWIGDIGRMALTNYLLQTLVCSLLFNHFGLFMRLDRLQLLAVVPVVWGVNLLFSHYWLRYFRQGPLEWLWRRLTAAIAKAA